MDQASWIDCFEKTARLILWLSISSVFLIITIAFVGQKREETKEETELRNEAKKAEAQLNEALEKATKPTRIAFTSLGSYIAGINYANAQGNLWFTNVSARKGFLCVVAEARDPDVVVKTAESLPACQEVGPYASEVHFSMMFTGGDLAAACPKSNCRLTFRDATESHD